MGRKQISPLNAVACIVLLSLAVVINCNVVTSSAIPPLCENKLIDEMPQKIRKVCAALENSNQFADALNAYIRKEAAAFLYLNDDVLAPSSNGKRTDVDHVFLRFGRKR